MVQAIPISQVVTINPAVVNAGGNPLALNAVFITQDTKTPTSAFWESSSLDEVVSYYGSGSPEALLAANYYNGYDNSTLKPSRLYFAGYANAARAAFLRGAPLTGMTLTQLQAISGTLSIVIDGVTKSGTVNLSAASSFSNAATLIGTALSLSGGQTATWDATQSRFVITSGTTGNSSTIAFATGVAAPLLGLTSGVISNGAAIDTPSTAMDRIKTLGQNWATFMTVFEPTLDNKTLFAVWTNNQNKRYAYVCWDSDAGYTVANNAAVFGSIVDVNNYEGTVVVYNTASVAAFECGFAASINWGAVNGRATPAFKSQSGLATTVSTLANATAVLSNNASYYGIYQAAGEDNLYNILYDGRMNGSAFRWFDTYINQVRLNSQLQLSIFVGLTQVNSAPYNSQGEALIRAWAQDPINEALNNGSIRTGVPLSNSQIATITSQAGLDISDALFNFGYYLQVLPATAQVRQQRQSPPVTLWYCDGGSIQSITMASIAIL